MVVTGRQYYWSRLHTVNHYSDLTRLSEHKKGGKQVKAQKYVPNKKGL